MTKKYEFTGETQDYLKDNLAFNIASRIDCAEREAAAARQKAQPLSDALLACVETMRAWNVPDGISGDEAMQRIVGALDNPEINPIILEAERG